jgi:hypothetical protein
MRAARAARPPDDLLKPPRHLPLGDTGLLRPEGQLAGDEPRHLPVVARLAEVVEANGRVGVLHGGRPP